MSKSSLNKEQADDDEREKEATSFTDSSLPQESNLTSVQAVDEAEQREANGSTQELDEGLEVDDTDQVKEDHFDDKKAGERDEEGEEGKKKAPKASKLRKWLRNMWTAPRNTQSRVQHDKEEDPRTGPNKDPDEADKKPRTCVGELDMGEQETGAETKKILGGVACVLHNKIWV